MNKFLHVFQKQEIVVPFKKDGLLIVTSVVNMIKIVFCE